MDKVTGDMMVRYTMAAQSALELLKQLLWTCRAYAGTPLGDAHAGGGFGQRHDASVVVGSAVVCCGVVVLGTYCVLSLA